MLKLIKYRDSKEHEYTWFYVNQEQVRISDCFASQKLARQWFDEQFKSLASEPHGQSKG